MTLSGPQGWPLSLRLCNLKKDITLKKVFFNSCFISFIDVITASTILQPCKSNHSSVSIFTSIIVYIKERKTTPMTH